MAKLTKGINIVKNLSGSSYLLEIDQLSRDFPNTIVIVDNNHQVDNLYDELKSIYKNKSIYKFPDFGISYYENSTLENTIIKNRYNALISIHKSSGKENIYISTYKSLFFKIPELDDISTSWSEVTIKSRYEDIIHILKKYNYTKVLKIDEPGQFRISGSIIDFFSIASDKPIRVNFFEDSIETMREFDIRTQISELVVESALITAKYLNHLRKDNIDDYINNVTNVFDNEYKDDLEFERIVKDNNFSSIHNLTPFFFKNTKSLLSFLDNKFVCFSKKNIIDQYLHIQETMENSYTFESKNRYVVKPLELLVSQSSLNDLLENNYLYLSSETEEIENTIKSNYTNLPSVVINYNYKDPFTNIQKLLHNSEYNFLFFIQRDDNFRTLTNYFSNNNIKYSLEESNADKHSRIVIYRADINQGFIDNANKKIYICSNDLFGLIKNRITKNKSFKSIYIDKISDLKIDDYVVHSEHGIGKYKGLITMDIEQKIIELIKIEYADSNNLYMPITSMTLIQKYIGSSGLNTKLATLGSDRWLKIKQRAKKKIEDIAAELLRVQAQREFQNGYSYTFDDNKYRKFCDLFPYIETDDQLNCINDVINDMSSEKSMDRLVCGDVGFGKTEVILRASFLAANNNKQVAVIVPTTVLAKQHYKTFQSRFNNYNYKVDLISRTISIKDKNKVLEDIRDGRSNIIIGTHALLNKNIKYYDLGLLVIDEEHKFGVKHKEAIKSFRENIDVLSLTATPIPRTLNSALSEIKDMSIINTPPIGRKNIETNIISKSSEELEMYINREINRGGQILFVHNNIETMQEEIDFLKRINHQYRVHKIHGQLNNREIENVMNSFINEQIDILVCTSIIESGLDMSNVNTIIINNAQNFGLSQLHQIRGRVGRSNRQAYAGLILCDPIKINKDAQKRLDAFIRTDSLAGGLEISGHDLEIRGAGEILGEEQSGQIFEIGYGMYTNLLSKAINQLKNRKNIKKHNHIDIDAYISTLIPQDYIEDIFSRLEFYNDISYATNEHEINQIITKFNDIYGPIPEYLENLLELTKVRIQASFIDAEKVRINKDNTIITLNDKSNVNSEKLINDYVVKEKIEIINKYDLKYRNNVDESFKDICSNIINFIKSITV